jgi:hypothetical protein
MHMKEIIVPCQFSSAGKRCGNKTKEPTGLCHQHKNKMPLKDIHEGTGKKPLLTAIPRVGPIVASNLIYTSGQPESNEEVAEQLEAVKQIRKDRSFLGFLRNPFNRKDIPTVEKDGYRPKLPPIPVSYGVSTNGTYPGSGRRSSSGSTSSSSSSSESHNNDSTQAAVNAAQSAANVAMGTFD